MFFMSNLTAYYYIVHICLQTRSAQV